MLKDAGHGDHATISVPTVRSNGFKGSLKMGQRRSVWALMGQPADGSECPKVRAVYFDKRDALKRIEWLERSAAGQRHKYWLETLAFFTSSRILDSPT